MLLTPHILVGAAVASRISNPFLAIVLALLSHYALDLIPHDDYSILNIRGKRWNKSFFDFFKVFSDITLGLLLVWIFSDKNLLIFAGGLAAIIPDAATLASLILPRNPVSAIHQKFHTILNDVGDRDQNKKITLFWAIVSQVVIAIAAILVLR